jgi:hypothetical protein
MTMPPLISGFLKQNWLTVLLFILALFNNEIRKFFVAVKTRTGSVFRGYRYFSAKSKMEEIQRLHGNAYELLLFLTVELVIFMGGGILIALSVYSKNRIGIVLTGDGWTAIIIALLVNEFSTLFRTIFRLAYYERSIRSLQRVMTKNAPQAKSAARI